MGNFLHTVDGPYVIEGINGGGQTAVKTEDLVGRGCVSANLYK